MPSACSTASTERTTVRLTAAVDMLIPCFVTTEEGVGKSVCKCGINVGKEDWWSVKSQARARSRPETESDAVSMRGKA
jgi:hypothetical protein